MTAAIFDVDRTVIDGMSGYYFASWLWKGGHLRAAARWRIVRSLILYRSVLRSEVEMVKVGATCLGGLSFDNVRELARRALAEAIWPRVFQEAVTVIRERNEAGCFTVLASGSAQPIVEALAERLGAQAAAGTRTRLGEDGVYLPYAESPYCYAKGKTELVEAILRERGLRLEDAEFYTDNGPDIPLLARVARPRAVNPDPTLARAASERGWPVLAWRTPLGDGFPYTGESWPIRSD